MLFGSATRSEQRLDSVCGRRPLTPLEAPFWAFEQLGDPAANVVPIRLDRCGAIEADRVEQTLRKLGSIHPALRLHLPESGRPFAAFAQTAATEVEEVTLEAPTPCERAQALEAAIQQRCKMPFDLAVTPLLRATVFKLTEAHHVLLFTFHHLVLDGWSAALFINEFTTEYDNPLGFRSPVEHDVAGWWTSRLAPPRLDELSNFWRAELADAPPASRFEDGGSAEPEAQAPSIEFDQDDAVLIKTAATAAGVSLYAWLVAALAVLINRHTGAKQIVIGTPVAFRPDEALRNVLGCMVASVPVRVMFANDMPFDALAKAARRTVLRAIAHADAPFHLIRSAAGGQPFDIMLNLLSFPRPAELGSGWAVTRVAPATARFNSTFYVDWSRSGGSITLVRDPGRISNEYASLLLRQLLHLLREASASPHRSVAAIDLMPGLREARDRLLALPLPFNRQASPLVDILHSAKEAPAAVAVEQDGRCWSYADLERGSGLVARSLLDLVSRRGQAPRDAIAMLHGGKSFGLVATVLGALRAGVPFLLVDPLLPHERVKTYRKQLGRVIAVSVARRHETPSDLAVDAATSLVLGESVCGDKAIDCAAGRDPAYVVFTSGTTGDPKPILGTHAGLAHFVRWQRDTFDIKASDRVPLITGLSFDVILRELLTPLSSGATICLPPSVGGIRGGMLAWLAEKQVTVLHAVPSLARRWLGEPARAKLPALRATFFAGETLTRELAGAWRERAPQAAIVNLFGPSETTLAKCFSIVPPLCRHDCVPVGRPLPDTQVFVEREGHAAATGEIGEVVLRTPYRSLGYVDANPASNRFRRNPIRDDEDDLLYWTGDLGRVLCDGSLQLLGRQDRQIKIRGVRIEPDEIAAVLRGLTGVMDGAVLFDQTAGTLDAFVVADVAIASLLANLRKLLPSAMIPSRVVRVAAIPVTPNGKVDYRALVAMPALDDAPARRVEISPSNPIAVTVTEAWRRYVSSETLSMEDDFFQVGGSSLDLIELHGDLCEALGRELNLAAFFQSPVLRNLCELALHDGIPALPRPLHNRVARERAAARRQQAREVSLQGAHR